MFLFLTKKANLSSWGANDRFDSRVRKLVSAGTMVLWGDGNGWLSLIVPSPRGPWLASCGPCCGKYYHRDCATGSTAMPRRWQTADPQPLLDNNLSLKPNTSLIKPPASCILFTFNLWLHCKSYKYLLSSWMQFKHVYRAILKVFHKASLTLSKEILKMIINCDDYICQNF